MNCEGIRHQLMDIAYGEGQMTAELREHLVGCAECAQFSAKLQQTQEMLGTLTLPEESGFRQIRATVVKAAVAAERRSLIFDLIKFFGLIILVFAFYFGIYSWQGLTGLGYVYLVLYLVLPLTLIPLRRYWIRKEGR